MFSLLQNLKNDERGAVAVDWIVLTAGIIGIGVTMASTLDAGLQTVIGLIFDNIDQFMDNL